MPNLFDLPKLDSRLLTLLKPRKPLPAFIAAVDQFVIDYTSDKSGPCSLFGKRWRENWRTEKRYYGTKILHIEELEEHAKDKLEAVCEGMVRLLEGSHCPRERLNHTKQLKDDLCLYLNCRDPKVGLPSTPPPKLMLTEPMTLREIGVWFTYHRNQVRKKVLANYWHESDGGKQPKYRMRTSDMPAAYHVDRMAKSKPAS
jgi:hypothetical protein